MQHIADRDLYIDASGKLTEDTSKARRLLARKGDLIDVSLVKMFDLGEALAKLGKGGKSNKMETPGSEDKAEEEPKKAAPKKRKTSPKKAKK